MARNIFQRLSKKCNRLPWISFTLKAKMCQRKSLYNTAKHLQTDNAWFKYCKLKNEINKKLKKRMKNIKEIYSTVTITISVSGNMLSSYAKTLLEFLH